MKKYEKKISVLCFLLTLGLILLALWMGGGSKPVKAEDGNDIQGQGQDLSEDPSENPSENMSENPSEDPSENPSENMSENPSENPSEDLSENPSEAPSEKPSEDPTENPSETPTEEQPDYTQVPHDDGYFYVTDFPGVVPSDERTDYRGIQQVLDKASAGQYSESNPLKIKFPAGTYYLEWGLTIYSNTEILMDSSAILKGKDGIVKGFIRGRDGTVDRGTYTRANNIKITGGIFDGEDISTTECAFLYFDHCRDITLDRITFRNSYSRHGITLDGVSGVTATNLTFKNCTRNGITDEAKQRTSEIFHVDHISTDGTSGSGADPYDDGLASENIYVSDCTFDTVNSGIGCHWYQGTTRGAGFTIRNCTFKNVKYTPIDLTSYNDLDISGNTADQGIYFILIKNCSGRVYDNEIKKTVRDSNGNLGFGISVMACDDNTSQQPLIIEGNRIYNSANNGIHVSDARDSGDTKEHENHYIEIRKNTIEKSGGNGIYVLKADRVEIEENTITSAKESGIVTSSVKNLTEEKNTISKSGTYGIYGKDITGLTVDGNTVSGCGSPGIFTKTSTGVVITNNSVKNDAGKNDISIENCSGYSEGNTVSTKIYQTADCITKFKVKEGPKKIVTINDKKYCYEKGEKLTGLQTVDGKTYYFDPEKNGASVSGLIKVGSAWYYFGTNGVMKTEGMLDYNAKKYYVEKGGKIALKKIVCVNGKYYYAGSDGAFLRGLRTINGKTYYFSTSYYSAETGFREHAGRYYFDAKGVARTGWFTVDDEKYYAEADGKIYCNTLFKADGKYYYGKALGAIFKSGWKPIGSKTYYFDLKTGEALTGFRTIKGNRFYFTAAGVLKKGWFKVGSKLYRADTKGKLVLNKLFKVGTKYYLADKNGALKTGWQKIGKKKYFFSNGDGSAITGFKTISKKKYYFTATGIMKTGWIKVKNKKYYADSNGVIQVGKTFKVGGKKYKADSTGVVK